MTWLSRIKPFCPLPLCFLSNLSIFRGAPDYVDNQTLTLEFILNQLIETNNERNLDIATGYFRIEAWLCLENAMNQLAQLRLLIGRDPSILAAERDRIDLVRFFRKDIQTHLEDSEFNSTYKNQINRLIAYLERDNVQVRLFGVNGDKHQFLHAKAYIFDHYSIVGSSNFTPSGLKGNTELNIINSVNAVARDLRFGWFNNFWNDESVDLDYKQKLIDVLNASKFGSKPYTPYQVFLKALYELFKDDSIIGEGDRTTLDLASFQHEGFERAVKLIEKHRGCIVADAVGLGKTFIGLRVLDYYLSKLRRPRYVPKALIICPAQLRDLVWLKKLDEFGIKANIVSQEEIGRKDFDMSLYRYHDLVVVDESHNFRNSGTNRYKNLQKLLGSGKRDKRVLLLTATPINNSIFDLYHQISLLTRSQDTYYRSEGISNLSTHFKALAKGIIESTDLLMETTVRRSRQDVIRRQEAGEEIKINGVLIKFPKRKLEQFTYNFEDSFAGLYANLAEQIDQLHLAPYNIKAFKRTKQKADEDEIKRNDALVALQKALYLKRLESSLIAFKNSIQNQRNFQEYFSKALESGKLLDSKNFRKFILGYLSEEDSNFDISEMAELLNPIETKDYQFSQLQSTIKQDIDTLNDIIKTLNKIEENVNTGSDYDQKLIAFKELFKENLKDQKVLVFFYYKDTANYVYQELSKDKEWLKAMGNPNIDLITGDTPTAQRKDKVKRFAPKANAEQIQEEGESVTNPIQILLSTDVLSEGQNLQDAGILINYSLHWNPVRMIQRAGRIDRLGSEYENLTIYNCFPEEGLETLLRLVERLQIRIATIDREVGLDASVLGEDIQGRSLEELRLLKKADTDEEKAAILDELEGLSDLVSLDEMRLPLLEFIQSRQAKEIEDIPYGIHSIYSFDIPDPKFKHGGIFLAFRAKDHHFWMAYPELDGYITTDPKHAITDKRKIFNWLKCKESDFPLPEEMPPQPFNNAIFQVLETATGQLLEMFKRQETGNKLKPKMTKLFQNISHALNQIDFSSGVPVQLDLVKYQSVQLPLKFDNPIDPKTIKLIQKVITNQNLKVYENDIRKLWESYVESKSLEKLIENLDAYFVENELYQEFEEEEDIKPLEIIQRENIKLICYQWFHPTI